MKYKIYFGHFGLKRGYVAVSENKDEYPCVYDSIHVLTKEIRKNDLKAVISLDFLDQRIEA